MKSQGFTIIELLVVIAIIGILSAVAVTALNSARLKANDAAIQSDFRTIRVQAEIYFGSTGKNSYGTAGTSCTTANSVFADPVIARAVTNAGIAAKNGTIACNNSAIAYALQAELNAPTATTYWCLDSTGKVGTSTTAVGTATACP